MAPKGKNRLTKLTYRYSLSGSIDESYLFSGGKGTRLAAINQGLPKSWCPSEIKAFLPMLAFRRMH